MNIYKYYMCMFACIIYVNVYVVRYVYISMCIYICMHVLCVYTFLQGVPGGKDITSRQCPLGEIILL